MTVLAMASSNLPETEIETLVSSRTQRAETQESGDLITESLPSNGSLHGASLTAVFRLSDLMSQVTYIFI
jgi:hypothetical protein